MTGECIPEQIRSSAFKQFERLAHLQEFCDEHYGEKITLQRAAEVICLEPTYFSTYFRAKVGVSFTCWLSHYRVVKAMALIEQRYDLLSVIATTVGFNSQSSFERAFKRSTGMTAAAYRAQCASQ